MSGVILQGALRFPAVHGVWLLANMALALPKAMWPLQQEHPLDQPTSHCWRQFLFLKVGANLHRVLLLLTVSEPDHNSVQKHTLCKTCTQCNVYLFVQVYTAEPPFIHLLFVNHASSVRFAMCGFKDHHHCCSAMHARTVVGVDLNNSQTRRQTLCICTFNLTKNHFGMVSFLAFALAAGILIQIDDCHVNTTCPNRLSIMSMHACMHAGARPGALSRALSGWPGWRFPCRASHCHKDKCNREAVWLDLDQRLGHSSSVYRLGPLSHQMRAYQTANAAASGAVSMITCA